MRSTKKENIMVNRTKLNKAIDAKGYRKKYLAGLLGISRQSLSNKISGKTPFKSEEVCILKDTLELSDVLLVEIFFASSGVCHAPTREAANA